MPTADRRRPRELAAAALRFFGVVGVVLGLVLAYANRVVFDDAAFAERSAAALGDPRVAAFVAERIADEVTARNRDLLAVRPVIVAAARTVVASEAFRALFRRATQSAHALAISQGARQVVLSLPDFAVLLNSTVARLQPDVAAKLPSGVRAQLGQDVQGALGAGALRFLQATSRLSRFTWLALGLGATLLLGSVGALPDRRRALLHAGLALAAAAIVLYAIPPLLGAAVSARIEDPSLRAAARGVWDAFTASLQAWALVLAAMGLVLGAAASSFASHVEVEDGLRATWAWLRRPSARFGVELARALALAAVGLALALRPLAVIRLAAVVVGAALAFEGLRGAFALLAPRIDEAADLARAALADAQRHSRARTPWLRYALVAIVVVASLAAGVLWLESPGALPLARFKDECNGSAALCDRPLDQVVFAGAHNAMSAADSPGWLFPNQEVGMAGQLRHGYRALLFDVHNGVPVAGRVKTVIEDEPSSRAKFEQALGKEGVAAAMRIRDRLVGPPEGPKGPYLCHGFCELGARPLVDALREIRDFLAWNPGEVILIVIEDYVPPAQVAKAFEESGLLRYVYRGAPGPWPTLRELVRQDQRVIVTAENETGNVPWYHLAYDLMRETPYHFESVDQLSCRPNRGGDGKPLLLMNHWIDTTPTPKPSNAEILNRRDFVLARARQCQRERGKLPNILAVDFALTGDVVGAAFALNGLGDPAAPAPAPAEPGLTERTSP